MPDDLDLDSPFTTAEWLAAGLPERELRDPRLRRLLRGVYVLTEVPVTAAIMVRAARRYHPGAFGAGHTAARMLGGVVPHTSAVTVGLHAGARSYRSGVRIRRYAAPPPLVHRDGAPCTDPARTFLDLAGELGLVDLVVLGDSLSQARAISADELRTAVAAYRGAHVRAARAAAAYVRDGAESAQETRARMLIVLAGLPEPATQVLVPRGDGGEYRLDLGWPEVKAAVEYDGEHHADRAQSEADERRRGELRADGWGIEVLTSPDIFRSPHVTVLRVADLLEGAGLSVRLTSQAWRAHFPIRASYLA